MNDFKFKLLHKDKKTKARIGEITTPHGIIHTPAFVPVGTQGSVKSLTPQELTKLNIELFFVNTYHMYLRPGIDVIKNLGGLHKFMNWSGPIITDSGGFQVFSLGRKKYGQNALNTGLTCSTEHQDNTQPILVKITDEGVKFQSHWDGSTHIFTPEKSMELQWQLGSDIHIAFDDCTPYPVTHKQAKTSLNRTHEWAERSLNKHKKLITDIIYSSSDDELQRGRVEKLSKKFSTSSNNKYQALYGVVHGSVFEDLRKKSAKFISSMDFNGIAIGGVSVGEGKTHMRSVCDWVIPILPENKPRHLLGVGEIDDIFDIIERGVDTFDCVQPTRLARTGKLFIVSKSQKYCLDITNKIYAEDPNPISSDCSCFTCQNFSRAYLHHLFHVRELLSYRLATIHNLHFVIDLVGQIKQNIKTNTFLQFKQNYLK